LFAAMKKRSPNIPPLLVVVMTCVLMWLVSAITSRIALPDTLRYSGFLLFVLTGTLVALAGVLCFRRANTTVNPLQPQQTRALVSTGIYRWTRNPMYLGFTACLIGWAIFLASPVALLLVAGFIIYIQELQIKPEERALTVLFGDTFLAYKSRVRRWL
jgi:protein-S-isoprenylcysteine O-methyltransferase Ste14